MAGQQQTKIRRLLARCALVAAVVATVTLVFLALTHSEGPRNSPRSSPAAGGASEPEWTPTPDESTAVPTPDPLEISDNFERELVSGLGTATSGQRWELAGSADLRIRNFAAEAEGTGAGYARAELPQPFSKATATASWSSATGVGDRSVVALISTVDESFTMGNMIHFGVRPSGWLLQIGDAGALRDLASGALSTTLDGPPVAFSIAIDGPTATLALPDGSTEVVTDAEIAAFHGRYFILELSDYPLEARPSVQSVEVEVEP